MSSERFIDGSAPLKGLHAHERALHAFYAAFNGRDLEGMAQCWVQSDEASLDNPLGGIRRGWREIEPIYRVLFQGPARVHVEFHEFSLHTCGSGFVAVGRERGEFVRDGIVVPLAIRTSRIFRQEGERWLQLHHHGSIDDAALLARYQRAVLPNRIPAKASK